MTEAFDEENWDPCVEPSIHFVQSFPRDLCSLVDSNALIHVFPVRNEPVRTDELFQTLTALDLPYNKIDAAGAERVCAALSLNPVSRKFGVHCRYSTMKIITDTDNTESCKKRDR